MHRFVLISITFENFISLQWLTLSLVIQPNCKFMPRSGLIATAVVISTSNETIVERMFQVRVITVSSFPTKQKSTMFFFVFSLFVCFFFFLIPFVDARYHDRVPMKFTHFEATTRSGWWILKLLYRIFAARIEHPVAEFSENKFE